MLSLVNDFARRKIARLPSRKRILIVNGHPDPRPERFVAALCNAYESGARAAGCDIRRMNIAEDVMPAARSLDGQGLPWLRDGFPKMFDTLNWADGVFVAFPMWMGGPPPALKQFFEEFARRQDTDPVLDADETDQYLKPEAHLVTTASMPSVLYRTSGREREAAWAQSLPGLKVMRASLIGSIDQIGSEDRRRWLDETHHAGRRLGANFHTIL
jgi:putative NADPH-quinone reductase